MKTVFGKLCGFLSMILLGGPLLAPESCRAEPQPNTPTASGQAEAPAKDAVTMHIDSLRFALDVYERFAKRKLWLSPEVPAQFDIVVSIEFEGSKDKALEVVQKALLEKGITIRNTETETFATLAP